jgi:hypothetical protein
VHAEDAALFTMDKALLALALLATTSVAGVTVHLQVRARLRTYDLARSRRVLVELEEERDVFRVRAAAIWTPERVAAAAESLRAQRRRREALADPSTHADL